MIRDRASEIRDAVRKIQSYAALSDQEFFADERNLYTVMHLLLIAIEASATICGHVLAKTASRAPVSYAECFEGLRDVHNIDADLTAKLGRMSRFRNMLVHHYGDDDPARVLEYARGNLGDFDAYLRAISEIIGQPV
jgi:uncharacterized protein YutE (UPF0331/DUF86 family)